MAELARRPSPPRAERPRTDHHDRRPTAVAQSVWQRESRRAIAVSTARPSRTLSTSNRLIGSPSGTCGDASHIGEPYFVLGQLGGKDWDWRVRAFFDETHPELAWFFMHDGRRRGRGMLCRLQPGREAVHRLHRPVGISPDAAAARAMVSREAVARKESAAQIVDFGRRIDPASGKPIRKIGHSRASRFRSLRQGAQAGGLEHAGRADGPDGHGAD